MEPGVYSWIQESPLGWEPKDTPSGLLRVEFSKQHGEGTALTYNLAYTDGATNLRRYFGESGPDATLPEGYRPVVDAAHVAASTMTAVPAVVWVGDDGVIYASAATKSTAKATLVADICPYARTIPSVVMATVPPVQAPFAEAYTAGRSTVFWGLNPDGSVAIAVPTSIVPDAEPPTDTSLN